MAVYLLRLLPTYQPSTLVRTRDPTVLSTCHTVVDVGGEYSPPTNRYDHHQRTFDTTFPKRSTKLSSAGLVYMHFGKPIIARQTKLPEDSPEVSILYEKLYADFVEALDAHDNGISVYDPAETSSLKKRFNDSNVTLGSLVNDLNHDFSIDGSSVSKNDTHPSSPEQLQAAEDVRFLQASSLMGVTFLRKLSHYHTDWLPALHDVTAAYTARSKHHSSEQILVFPSGSVPWKDHLYGLENQHPESPKVLYILYPESTQENSKWRIQCVPVAMGSFESRRPLKQEWRGVRDEELSRVSGIDGGIFVHASGFVGGNKTREGAMKMATAMLEE